MRQLTDGIDRIKLIRETSRAFSSSIFKNNLCEKKKKNSTRLIILQQNMQMCITILC